MWFVFGHWNVKWPNFWWCVWRTPILEQQVFNLLLLLVLPVLFSISAQSFWSVKLMKRLLVGWVDSLCTLHHYCILGQSRFHSKFSPVGVVSIYKQLVKRRKRHSHHGWTGGGSRESFLWLSPMEWAAQTQAQAHQLRPKGIITWRLCSCHFTLNEVVYVWLYDAVLQAYPNLFIQLQNRIQEFDI